MKPEVYTVHAHRWGNRDNHSYIVGVYPDKEQAIKAAEDEEQHRGGKYSCEVTEWSLGIGYRDDLRLEPITVRPLTTHPHFTQPKGTCPSSDT